MASDRVVGYTAVFSVTTQRSSPQNASFKVEVLLALLVVVLLTTHCTPPALSPVARDDVLGGYLS